MSLYGGDPSYYTAAERLRTDCIGLELDHEIVEAPSDRALTWLDLCRRKVGFYLEMHHKHQRPILWLDADSRIISPPTCFEGLASDIAGFLRGLRYLRDFDPLAVPRFFAPFALYINYTPAATAFLELMARIERAYPGDASDDYFLHEAWLQHKEQLSVTVLPPSLVGHDWPLRDKQMLYVGISGNVRTFKASAKQHPVPLFDAKRRKLVLVGEGDIARKEGNIEDALVFYRRALALTPDDEQLVTKVARLTRQKLST